MAKGKVTNNSVLIEIPFRLENGMTLHENEQRKNVFKQAALRLERELKEGKFVVIHDFRLRRGGPLSECRNCGVIRLNTDARYSHCIARDIKYSGEYDE